MRKFKFLLLGAALVFGSMVEAAAAGRDVYFVIGDDMPNGASLSKIKINDGEWIGMQGIEPGQVYKTNIPVSDRMPKILFIAKFQPTAGAAGGLVGRSAMGEHNFREIMAAPGDFIFELTKSGGIKLVLALDEARKAAATVFALANNE
jgi:hypothetical protein